MITDKKNLKGFVNKINITLKYTNKWILKKTKNPQRRISIIIEGLFFLIHNTHKFCYMI